VDRPWPVQQFHKIDGNYVWKSEPIVLALLGLMASSPVGWRTVLNLEILYFWFFCSVGKIMVLL